MSWAEVQSLTDKITALANATLHFQCGKGSANKTLMLKRYDSDYMRVTLDSQGAAEIPVAPKSRYEAVTEDETDQRTTDVFYVDAGEYKEVYWDMGAYNGDTITPINDAATLQKCAGVYGQYNYSSISEVLADIACLASIINSENASKYLVRCTNFIPDFIASENAASLIGKSVTCSKHIMKNLAWSDAVLSSPHTDLFLPYDLPTITTAGNSVEGIINADGVTIMGGWNPTSGAFSPASEESHGVQHITVDDANTYEYYGANDMSSNLRWAGIKFTRAICVKQAIIKLRTTSSISSTGSYTREYALEFSDDGSTWTAVKSIAIKTPEHDTYATGVINAPENIEEHKYWRIKWNGCHYNYAGNNYYIDDLNRVILHGCAIS